MIKLITKEKHRFNRSILVKGTSVIVNGEGVIEVPENLVVFALEIGFELVDKNVKFTSVEEMKKVEEMSSVIESAHLQAKTIIEDAHKEAEKIIQDAQIKAGKIIQDSGVTEKEEFLKVLQEKRVDELRTIIVSSEVKTSEEALKMKKQELIDALFEARFSEEDSSKE